MLAGWQSAIRAGFQYIIRLSLFGETLNFVSSAMHMQGERTHEQRPSCHRPIVHAVLPCLAKGVRRIGCFPCNDVVPTRGDQHST